MNDAEANEHEPLSRIRVVLVEPSHPGNIGAAARALKTMGLARLALVRPRSFPDPEARAMAAHAVDVLEAARVCETLDEALAGTVMSISCVAMGATVRRSSSPSPRRARRERMAPSLRPWRLHISSTGMPRSSSVRS